MMTSPQEGRLAQNIAHFGRALRAAGMTVGTGRILNAVEAVRAAGFGDREDFYWTLHACFVSRPEHRELFDQSFSLFWRDPQFLERLQATMLPDVKVPPPDEEKKAAETRAMDAMSAEDQKTDETAPPQEEIEFDATLTFSADEKLKTRDFEQMTAEEARRARDVIARLSLPVPPIISRRSRPSPRGRYPDWRATIRASMRLGGGVDLKLRERRKRWPSLIALCDISGSMSDYSRMLLHFLHAAANAKGAGWSKIHAFTFGTRLTNITRHLARRDVDEALRLAGEEAQDWEGGTRIGHCLQEFNRDWSRRVLGQGAVVLLITDGLDRDDPDLLRRQAERLHLSCRRLIWLNPLLRWEGFAPKASGIRALLPNVDSFRAAHNIESLQQLAATLAAPDDGGDRARLMRLMPD